MTPGFEHIAGVPTTHSPRRVSIQVPHRDDRDRRVHLRFQIQTRYHVRRRGPEYTPTQKVLNSGDARLIRMMVRAHRGVVVEPG